MLTIFEVLILLSCGNIHEITIELLEEYNEWLTLLVGYVNDAHQDSESQKLSPNPLIDKVWHAHILETLIIKRLANLFVEILFIIILTISKKINQYKNTISLPYYKDIKLMIEEIKDIKVCNQIVIYAGIELKNYHKQTCIAFYYS